MKRRAFANEQLTPDIDKVAGGKTYSQGSEEWIAGGMKSEKLAGERTSLFMGETLKGLLLNAWGWAQVGSIAILAGILLIVFGGILFALPAARLERKAALGCSANSRSRRSPGLDQPGGPLTRAVRGRQGRWHRRRRSRESRTRDGARSGSVLAVGADVGGASCHADPLDWRPT